MQGSFAFNQVDAEFGKDDQREYGTSTSMEMFNALEGRQSDEKQRKSSVVMRMSSVVMRHPRGSSIIEYIRRTSSVNNAFES